MVEIEVRLLRGSVYFAGEPIRCQITFTNTTKRSRATNGGESLSNCVLPSQFSNKKFMGIETVAWASAQIHCQCTINDARVQLAGKDRKIFHETAEGSEESMTSFMPSKGERGRCLLSTKPKILFCDVKLAPGESKSYYYEDSVPFGSPPSYRGLAVKYSYKITVGAGRLRSSTKMLRFPVRILVLEDLKELHYCTENDECLESNPFINETVRTRSLLDVALNKLTNVTCKKNQCIYNVGNKDGQVGCFILFKSAFKIGDEILGVFDFRDCNVNCPKLVVTLQSEEHVCEEYKKNTSRHFHSHISYSTQEEFCLYSKKIQIHLPIPITATPEFTSDLVDVLWRLHFEFYLSSTDLCDELCPERTNKDDDAEPNLWEGPSTIDIQPMTWDLPIKILPCNPIHASAVSLLRTTSTSTF